jgi:hypothetical protein
MIKVVELTDRSPSIRLQLETAIGFSSAALMALSIAGSVIAGSVIAGTVIAGTVIA